MISKLGRALDRKYSRAPREVLGYSWKGHDKEAFLGTLPTSPRAREYAARIVCVDAAEGAFRSFLPGSRCIMSHFSREGKGPSRIPRANGARTAWEGTVSSILYLAKPTCDAFSTSASENRERSLGRERERGHATAPCEGYVARARRPPCTMVGV